jgi:hypothetical protein
LDDITCKTERAWLLSIPEPSSRAIHMLEGEAVIHVYDSGERWAGCLRVRSRAKFWRLLSRRERYELATISTGSIDSSAGGWTLLDEYPQLQREGREVFEFYNVLWVGWRDGVAVRQGIGRVDKAVWELQSREEINLVLGWAFGLGVT